VHYRYVIDGRQRIGERDFRLERERVVPGIERGTLITVLYDPDRPRLSGWLEPSLEAYVLSRFPLSMRSKHPHT
jgi:hypothetical protein